MSEPLLIDCKSCNGSGWFNDIEGNERPCSDCRTSGKQWETHAEHVDRLADRAAALEQLARDLREALKAAKHHMQPGCTDSDCRCSMFPHNEDIDEALARATAILDGKGGGG